MAKPKTPEAMTALIEQIRLAIPFELPESTLCDGICQGCSKKVIDYLQSELESWEYRITQGDIPNFGEISKLAKQSKKIHNVLQKNGFV